MVELKHLTKYYYSSETITMALENVNLQFDVGDFVAVTGESGSGKSTLLKVISGTETYEDGELYFDGVKTSAFAESDWDKIRGEQIAMIYQDYQLLENYSVIENVESVLLICADKLGMMSKAERRQKAMSYLQIVGLEKQAGQKAAHLSSGQKQRLGIARALAKQTKIIIADEPTGNLDAENGSQIMELLGKLTKDHLILVVTHNIDQAEPYITRRVRLFDGSVTEDIRIKERIKETETTETEEKEQSSQRKKSNKKRILLLTGLELRRMPFLSALLLLFFLCSAVSVLFALGIFAENEDDLNARFISGAAFSNRADTRLVIRTIDGSAVRTDQLDQLRAISHVMTVDGYDMINDINYMYQEGQDYDVNYEYSEITNKGNKTVTLTGYSHFMRSEDCITEADLKEGRLPEEYHEIVVGASDADLYGETFPVYFTSRKLWASYTYFCVELTVVGVCENNSDQIYFDEELCESLCMTTYNVQSNAVYEVERTLDYKDPSLEDRITSSKRSFRTALICNPNLEGYEVRLPAQIVTALEHSEMEDRFVDEHILETGVLEITNPDSIGAFDLVEAAYDIKVTEESSLSSNGILEIGPQLFEDIFGVMELTQASVYIDYYANADRVLEQLSKYGYELVSVIRVSAGDYNNNKVTEQMVSLAISAGAAIVFFLFDLVVLVMMMRTKRKNYMIFRSLGLEKNAVTIIIVLQIMILAVAAFLAAPAAAICAAAAGVKRLLSMLYYFRISHAIVYLFYVCLVIILCGMFSNRLNRKERR